MDTTEIVILALQGIVAILVIVAYVEIVRARLERVRQERRAGTFLVDQILDAPAGTVVILGAATYRTGRPIRILRDGIRLRGMPEGTSRIIGEDGADPIVSVTDAKGVEISHLHLECPRASAVRFAPPSEEPLEDAMIVLNTDGKDISEIMRREYRDPDAVH